MLEQTLQDLGFTKRESQCYVALLELGSTRVGPLLKKTHIPSSKIYELLDGLCQRGLVTYVIKNNVKHYQAANPHTLLHLLTEKKRSLEAILPQLLLKQKFAATQSVELFEGQKAIFTLFTNMIADVKSKELYLVFSINEEHKTPQANLFFLNLATRRSEKKLDVRVLRNQKYYVKEKHTKLQLRYTSFNLPQGVTIFRNTLILLSWDETPTAVKIESEAFAQPMREFFLDLWKKAKR